MKIWKFTALALCFFLTFRVLYANDPIYFSASLYEKISQTYGNSAKRRVQKWEGLLTSLKSDGIDDQLYEVNAFFNAIPYYSDAKHWGKSDYWATPEPNAIPFILDNINQRILPANKRQDLRPVYSFNGEGLWMAKAQGRGTQVGNSRHKMWDDLTTRIERDF